MKGKKEKSALIGVIVANSLLSMVLVWRCLIVGCGLVKGAGLADFERFLC